MVLAVLTVNCGSSSLKASLSRDHRVIKAFHFEHLDPDGQDFETAFDQLFSDIDPAAVKAIGHRFVHGGDSHAAVCRLDEAQIRRLEQATHYAPLHMPINLKGVRICQERSSAPQFACFDTAFHTTMPDWARRLPIPTQYGLRRHGFHGISYANIARKLPAILGELAFGKVVVAHLGNGASLCLMENLKSVDTTMGLTPTGGIPMGTRSGDLDPGVVIELSRMLGLPQAEHVLCHRSGLLALSNDISGDMAQLASSDQPEASFAIDYFARQIRRSIGAYASEAGGIDALVFTGGIGEHSAEVRRLVCEPLSFMQFAIEPSKNAIHAQEIHRPDSKPILVIHADEEHEIRLLVEELGV